MRDILFFWCGFFGGGASREGQWGCFLSFGFGKGEGEVWGRLSEWPYSFLPTFGKSSHFCVPCW